MKPRAPTTKKLSWSSLEVLFGVSRKTIHMWRKRDDAPTTPDPHAWEKYVEENELGISPTTVPTDRESLLREKLRREIALLDLRISRERREVIPLAELGEILGRVAAQMKTELLQWAYSDIPSKAVGADVAEVREWWVAKVDELCAHQQGALKRWLTGIEREHAKKTPPKDG